MNQSSTSMPRCDAPGGECHVCGDVAVPATVVEIDHLGRTAIVAVDGERMTVGLDFVEADIGDQLLVHLGFAIARLERT